MAAYAASVSSLMERAEKIDAVVGIGIFAGKCNVTNYNQTLAAITDISGKFKSVIAVVAGISDSGYLLEWVAASKAFKAYITTNNSAADTALHEAASDTDVGEVQFIAFGLV